MKKMMNKPKKSRYYVLCPVCKKNKVYAPPAQTRRGHGKYCSNLCFRKGIKDRSIELSKKITYRHCKRCGEYKEIKNFSFNKSKAFGFGRSYYCKDCMSNIKYLRNYGLDKKQIEELGVNGCNICGVLSKLRVDHDHLTGKIRGILCDNCNVGLGHFKDSVDLLQKGKEYLSK